MISDRPLTAEDADAVLADLCAVHATEMAAAGLDTRQCGLIIAAGLACGRGRGSAAVIDGVPVALFYHSEIAAGRRSITFAARQCYFDAGMPAVRHARRYLAGLGLVFPGVRFEAMPGTGGARVARWLATIGFVHDGSGVALPTVDAAATSLVCPPSDPPTGSYHPCVSTD